MTLHVLDHIAFLFLAVAFPIHGFFAMRKRAALIRAGRTELRMKLYRTIVWQKWTMVLVLFVLWFGLGRDAAQLGLGLRGDALGWAGYGLAAVLSILLVLQVWSIKRSPKSRQAVREKVASLSFLLPQTVPESRAFNGVSVTAGICEEILIRGFLIAYLMSVLEAPFWLAGAIASVVFGAAHAYQGPSGFARCAAVGGLMTVLYGLTGSLWAPILVHAVMDMTSGRIAYIAFSEQPENSSPPATA